MNFQLSWDPSPLLMGERMKSRGTESSQSLWQTGSGNERGLPVGRQGTRSKLRKTCCFFRRRFSFWSAWSHQRSSKDSAKDRGCNTGYRDKARRKQCFSHFVPQPAHNKQYLGNFPRQRLSVYHRVIEHSEWAGTPKFCCSCTAVLY